MYKINYVNRNHLRLTLFKCIIRMKIIAFFIMALCVHIHAHTYGQKVTLNFKNVELITVLDEIQKQTGYDFLYNSNILGQQNNISVNVEKAELKDILGDVLHAQNLDFEINRETVLIKKENKVEDSNSAQQQSRTLRGRVRTAENVPLGGVSVLLKGTNVGTVTNDDGEFELKISDEGSLIFSLVGFSDQETSTKDKDRFNIILKPADIDIDEVVVTGYSQLDRQHVASSVASLDMKKTKSRPIHKMEEAFSGTIPGVTMLQGNNMPGEVPGSISIRGISTLKGSDPLVIVDGMEHPLTDIDPNQIKSINVLKDAASTSLYGSRGANGVIIVETERGQTGQFEVNINSWASMDSPIDLPEFVNAPDYMKLNNWAKQHQGQSPSFSEEDIEKAETGEMPSVNWLDEIMQRKAHTYNTSANISGGGGVGTFNLMLNHIKENGLNDIEGSQKFSARFNTNINIADRFVLLADFYAHRLQVDRLMANDNGHGLYQLAWRSNPTQQVYYDSDLPEHYVLHDDKNPIASINRGGTKNNVHERSIINLRPKYNVNDNLSIEGNVSYRLNKSASKTQRRTFKFYDGNGAPKTIWTNSVGSSQGVSKSLLTARALINYNTSLRDDRDMIYIIGGSEIMNEIRTDYKEVTKSSFFAKVNYSFDNRYIAEVTARSDGSSKFAPGHRWGFFPSGALAWNMHNEGFFEELRDSKAISNLKIRASYGLIGNENVEPYMWEEIVNTWGWTMRVPNPLFSWEKQKQWNVGLDLTALNDRLHFTGEIYNKHSYDLIYDSFPVPPLTGANSLESAVNIGEVENKGWELSASWGDKIGNLSYNVGGMLFDNVNQILKAGYSANDTLIFKGTSDKIWYKGIALDNYYGFQTDGYFQNQEEIDNTDATFPNTLPGDIRYVDQNDDGTVNDQDRVNLGDPYPHMNYSISVDLGYKQWDFSFLGQGVGKRTARIVGQEAFPVYMDGDSNAKGAPRQYYADNRWTPETPNSRFPRVWTGSTTNDHLSDLWLSDASYFRVKMLQLGYTFPKVGKNIKNVRVYFNAQDVFTFTKFEGLEPERGWSNSIRNQGNGSYPRMATYSFGVNFTIL